MSADQCAQLLVTGFTLNQAMLIPRANHFFTSPNDHATFYMAFVSEDNKMRLVSKVELANNSEGGKFINFLNDGLSEFVIFCEKDQLYMEEDMLKSAGIQTSSHHSLQTTGAMPQSMMSDNELLSAFM